MKVAKYAIWAAAVIGAVLVGWTGREKPAQHAREPASVPRKTAVASEGSHQPVATSATIPVSVKAAPPASNAATTWGSMLRESDDYWAFAEKAHKAAMRGDAAAQWYLGLALNECQFNYDGIFLRDLPEGGFHHRTVDEAREFIRLNVTRPLISSDEDLALLKKRCGRLSEAPPPPPFGYGMDWTEQSAIRDFPPAQAMAAQAMAAQIKAGRAQYDSSKATQAVARAEARSLAIEALRTRDPEVLQQISEVAAALVSENETEATKRRLTWMVAACLRSPNCESLSEPMKARCKVDPQCQPYETPLDILRRDAGNDFDEIERRARELNEKIDAGTIEESDI